MESVLETIVARSRAALEETKRRVPAAELERRIAALPPCGDFAGALAAPGFRVIAELKAASPSRGVIRRPLAVRELAAELEQAGAAALSVLTERNFFLGGLENLETAAETVSIPLLRKDFIYDEYQLLEARASGADAVLLIAAMLPAAAYRRLYCFASELGLAVLSEAHTEAELEMLLENGGAIIGVNARNLANFETSLELSAELLRRIPSDRIAVGESAIRCRQDMEQLRAAGARAFLIGETLMRAPPPGEKVCGLLSK